MDPSAGSKGTPLYGLSGPGGTAAVVALKSGGANAVVGALVVLGLIGLARKAIRLAGDPTPDGNDRPPVAPP